MIAALMLAKRNALCFFRDRASVMFSFITAFVVVALHLLFLRNVLINSMYSGSWEFISDAQVPALVDSWVMAGIIGIVSVTSCVEALQIMVDDKVTGRDMDLRIAPIGSAELSASYILSTFIVGMTVSSATLGVVLVYLYATGCVLSVSGVVTCFLLLIPSTLITSAIVFALASFLRSQGAFSGFSILMSMTIGLLYGMYLPLVNLPSAVIFVGNLVPATHMVAIFRQFLCAGPMDEVFAPADEVVFRSEMGIDLSLGDLQFSAVSSMLYSLAVAVLFFAIAVLIMRRKRS
jgi:multidrug/hemolysin transport system permease protein